MLKYFKKFKDNHPDKKLRVRRHCPCIPLYLPPQVYQPEKHNTAADIPHPLSPLIKYIPSEKNMPGHHERTDHFNSR